jgi:hypothetical protein
MKNRLCIALAVFLMCSCAYNVNPLAPKVDTGPSFQFLDYNFNDNTKNGNVELAPEGIYAIDKNTVFIFGAIEKTGNGEKRTFILRSADGGQTWIEVSKPEMSNTIYHLAFVDGGYGWALAIRKTNDVGSPKLYRSSNNGKTWSEPALIKVSGMSFFPLGMKFTNKDNGIINFMDVMMIPSDRFGTITTSDGGLKWQETFSLTVPYDKDFQNAGYILDKLENEYSNDPGGFYGNHWLKLDSKHLYNDETFHATGHDGSEWHLYYHEMSKEYILIRRVTTTSNWEVTVTIPSKFAYSDGRMSKP